MYMFSFVIFIPLIIVLLAMFLLVGFADEKRRPTMIRNIYLYLVSFVTLIIIIFSVNSLVRETLDIVFPEEYTYGLNVNKFENETKEQYEERLERQKEEEEVRKKNQKLRNKKDIATSAAMLLVALPLFIIHTKKADLEFTKS